MPVSLVDVDSLLAVDVGSVTTRAVFFDVVDGHYRFIASGQAPTCLGMPLRDISKGMIQAIENLESIIQHRFLDANHRLIMPSTQVVGADIFAATLSAGPPIRTAVIGLLDEVSLESTLRLARSTYTSVVETIGLNDTRKPEQQIDSLVRLSPELILISGGTDGGASRSVQRLMEAVGLACYLLPVEKRPALLYAGNQALVDEVKESFQGLTSSLRISPNLRPGIETEDLHPAHHVLAELVTQVRRNQFNGIDELTSWSGNSLLPTASAQGRIIRFLSQVYDSSKGILGVDLGASAATVAAAFGGDLTLCVYPQLGLGESLAHVLRYTSLEEILRWIPFEISSEELRAALMQKSIYPASLPATPEDLYIEQAVARQCLQIALKSAGKDFPQKVNRAAVDLPPYFEPILATGSVITRAPTLGQSLMILLDAIQPVGITTVILDQNNLLSALGAAAGLNSLLPIQVLESGAFLGLAMVVAPVVNTRPGTPILRARLVFQDGNESHLEVKQGGLEVVPLPVGQSGRLYLQPLHHADVGFGPDRTREKGIPITGTGLGLVFDARGRPLRLPTNGNRRREALRKWLEALGG